MPPVFFAATTCVHTFFGLPTWWKFLPAADKPVPPDCSVTLAGLGDFWLIGLAVINMLLYVAGFVAVVSIVIAGFEYVFSLGNADKITGARKRIQNSVIGLAIALVAVVVVTFLGNALG